MQLNIVAGHLAGQGGTERVIIDFANGLSHRGFKINLFLVMDKVVDDRWLLQLNPGVTVKQLFVRNSVNKAYVLWKLSQRLAGIVLVVNIGNLRALTYFKRVFKHHYIVVSWIHGNLFLRSGYQHLPTADYHLAISKGIQKQLLSLAIPEERIFTILDPVDIQTKYLPKTVPSEPVRLLYIGRMDNNAKNIQGLIDICGQLTGNFQLDIYGDGPDFAAMKQYAKAKSVTDQIVWHGQVINPWRLIEAVDVLLLTSNFEGLALVLLEAMSYGVPCVAYDCPVGPGEIIQSGQNGYLIPDKNQAAFVTQTQSFIDRKEHFEDPKAIQKSIDRFYEPAYFERLERIFHEMH